MAPGTAHAAKAVSLQPLTQAAFAPTGVFQSLEIATNAVAGLDSWRSVQARMGKEAKLYAACDTGSSACPAAVQAWRSKLKAWGGLSAKAKLIQVNRFANAAIAYTDDRKAFRKADYWAAPAESLKGRGDCEDYALLKYASLRALGFSEEQLRIVIVKDLSKGIGHAVLSVKMQGSTFILDNQDSRVLRHDTVAHYAPIYSINRGGRWINIATRDLKKLKPAPEALVASAEELGDMLPAAAAALTPVTAPAKILQAAPANAADPRPPVAAGLSVTGTPVSIAAREPAVVAEPPVSGRTASATWPPIAWLLSHLPV